MKTNYLNREDNTIFDLLKKAFTKTRSRRSHKTCMISSRNHNSEIMKIDADSSRFHKPSKGLAIDLCLGKRKNRDDSRIPTFSKALSSNPPPKKMKIIQPQTHKPSKGLSRDVHSRKTKIQDDHCSRTQKPSKELSRNLHSEKGKNDHCPQIHKPSKSLSRDLYSKKAQQQGVAANSMKMKIQDDYNSPRIHKPSEDVKIDQDASSRRTHMKTQTPPLVKKTRSLATQDAESKHNARILEAQFTTTTTSTSFGALITMEEYLKNSTEKILLEGDDDESWWCKPMSEYVIPGAIPDLDALNHEYSITLHDFFVDVLVDDQD